MLFRDITILDEDLNVAEHQYVGVLGDKIAYIGGQMPQEDFGESYDGKNKILMTGLFNSHTHLPMTLLRGYAENKNLQDWLFNRIFPFEAKMNSEDVYYAALLGMAEMIRFGTISATEMYFHTESIIKAAIDCGVKLNISAGTVAFDDGPLSENKNFREEQAYYRQYHLAEGGRIRADMSLHAEYTTNARLVQELAEYCAERDQGIHVHVSETRQEVLDCKQRHDGLTPPEYLAGLGLFQSRVTAAHCVWLEPQDFDLLASNHVTVAHCPVSNMKLASGVADVPQMLERGVNVALGTDGVASNNNFDLWEDMKIYAMIHKCNKLDPTLITPRQVLQAATINGAIGQGREDCGCLKVGNKADLIVVSCDNTRMTPVHSLINNIVYSMDSSDVVLTMVDGKILYRDGEFTTIDLEKVTEKVKASKKRIVQELG